MAAAFVRSCRTQFLRAAAVVGASAVSIATIHAEETSTRDALGSSPSGLAIAPASDLDRRILKNTRLLVRDALEGDCSLWKLLLQREQKERAEKLMRDDGAELRARIRNMMLFSGRANPQLADELAYELGMPLGRVSLNNFADGEISVHVLDSVRGKDVYVVQSTSQPVNESLVELILIISALRRASAHSITAIVPYYGYKRDVGTVSSLTQLLREDAIEEAEAETATHGEQGQGSAAGSEASPAPSGAFGRIVAELLEGGTAHAEEQKKASTAAAQPRKPRIRASPEVQRAAEVGRTSDVPVSASDVAIMLEAAGVDKVLSVELQPPGQGQIEGFFPKVPVESLRATAIGVEHIAKLGLQRPVVVAPNEACIQLAHDFRSLLASRTGGHVGFACIVEAGPSRGSDRYVHAYSDPRSPAERMELVGDVYGRDVVVVDDMLDTARTLMTRLDLLKERGAKRLVAYATHGLFNDGALQRITKSQLSDVIVTNTVPLRDDVDVRHTHKIAQLSVAPLLAEAALRTQLGLSLLHLRKGEAEPEPRYKGQE